ncbi:MAG TPA: octaprenyl diphosphate synthase [Cycloclasticus sp.]|jgi:octaprenyl-diphosphate synthase|nr:octaprenyl diphosphate synthase [Cycloclasticus sp.]HIL94252.1 octaprenyl diphosphate synthase [Cycloclasticus sp.]
MSSTHSSTNTAKIDFKAIQVLMAPAMSQVDKEILRELNSDVVLINQIGFHIINSGGKRLRPMLVALSACALDYDGKDHTTLAAVIEFIHTATLLHDDVVDESDMRRGDETANAIWGNAASVLVGDFLYSRSFEMMVGVNDMRVMDILSHTTNAIAEGEVLQLLNINNPDTSEAQYLEVIRRKTAKLFEAAAQLGAVLSKADDTTEKALAAYGLHLGNAFQIMDDMLDYTANVDELGKNLGDDLAEGKPTLPLIHAMTNGTAEQAEFIRETIKNGNRDAYLDILAIIKSTGSLDYTAEFADQEAKKAIDALSSIADSNFKTAMEQLALFSIQRSY